MKNKCYPILFFLLWAAPTFAKITLPGVFSDHMVMQQNSEVALWGWVQGVSKATWLENAGVDGYRGATMHADLNGNGSIDTSVTWAGLTLAEIPASTQHDNLLWFA